MRIIEIRELKAHLRRALRDVLRVAWRSASAYQPSPLTSRDGLARQLLDEDRGDS